MKLGELRAAIRTAKGNPHIVLPITENGKPVKLALLKGLFLEELGKLYPDQSHETGLTYDAETGLVGPLPNPWDDVPATTAAPAAGPLLDLMEAQKPTPKVDLDDL